MSSLRSEPRSSGAGIAVGVYDEPQLIVSGVRGMFSAHGARAWVQPLADARGSAKIDVLLCDPMDRDVEVEDYLARVATLTAAPIVVFSWTTRPHSIRRALAAGARAYVSKGGTAQDLISAIEAAHRGEVLSPSLAEAVDLLSARETDVLHLICRGMSNDEIADTLFVSVNSVKTYIRQVYQKIGVNRRAQAVAWGIGRGY
jgi:DNA-binding NarL/FixJ family response regulator